MKNMRVIWLLLVAVLLVGLVACGGGDTAPAEEEAPAAEEPAEEPAAEEPAAEEPAEEPAEEMASVEELTILWAQWDPASAKAPW